jgi:hypothetical protein
MSNNESITSRPRAPGSGLLHPVSASGAAAEALDILAADDQLVFINEGVTALLHEDIRQTLAALQVAPGAVSGVSGQLGIMAEHAALFGIVPVPGMQSLSMADLVQRVAACRSSLTWS